MFVYCTIEVGEILALRASQHDALIDAAAF